MKKILIKIISCITSMMIIPSSCMAWTNEHIQKTYEDYFGTKYTSHIYGLKALTCMLSGEDILNKIENSKAVFFASISTMQKFLEDNYESFRPHFPHVDKAQLEYTCNKIADKILGYARDYRQLKSNGTGYEKQKAIKALDDFDENRQRFILEQISVALQTEPNTIQFPVLIEMAAQIAESLNLKLGREEKRRKSVLLKWFDTNWEIINPVIKTLTIVKA